LFVQGRRFSWELSPDVQFYSALISFYSMQDFLGLR
jgi:hypothetical protein